MNFYIIMSGVALPSIFKCLVAVAAPNLFLSGMLKKIRYRSWLLTFCMVLAGLVTRAQGPTPVWQGSLPVVGQTVPVPSSRDDLYVAGVAAAKPSEASP